METQAPGPVLVDADEAAAALAATIPALSSLPEGIEGLDVKSGLGRMLGKKTLYLAMLRKYTAGQKDASRQIRQALDDGDWALAERLAHTLKGVAGTIGATRIPGLAAELEQALNTRAALDEVIRILGVLEIPLITANEFICSWYASLCKTIGSSPTEVMSLVDTARS
jgi:two-component system, sensor histidine kinase and response regulator